MSENKAEIIAAKLFWKAKNGEWVPSFDTSSMEPLIRGNDLVKFDYLEEVVLPDLKIGDILVFVLRTKLIAHRLIYIDISKHTFLIKGDNNHNLDKIDAIDCIVGKLIAAKRGQSIIKLNNSLVNKTFSYISLLDYRIRLTSFVLRRFLYIPRVALLKLRILISYIYWRFFFVSEEKI